MSALLTGSCTQQGLEAAIERSVELAHLLKQQMMSTEQGWGRVLMHGYGYGYGYRDLFFDGYGYGYGYLVILFYGYGYGYGYFRMGTGTGTGS